MFQNYVHHDTCHQHRASCFAVVSPTPEYHIPYTHHRTVGNRANVAPVELEVLESGKWGFKGVWEEGPRKGTNLDALAKLRPVFKNGGTVTAGNSSQTSDGAAFVMVMSEDLVKELNVQPIARLIDYKVVGLAPRIMGVGPLYAIPETLKRAGLKQNDLEQIELNEAFASQSVAILKGLDLNPELVNVNGGAIALGHPLGCTGAKLTVQLINEMKRRKQKIGAVTMCVGTGQGACGIFEIIN